MIVCCNINPVTMVFPTNKHVINECADPLGRRSDMLSIPSNVIHVSLSLPSLRTPSSFFVCSF